MEKLYGYDPEIVPQLKATIPAYTECITNDLSQHLAYAVEVLYRELSNWLSVERLEYCQKAILSYMIRPLCIVGQHAQEETCLRKHDDDIV